MPSANPRYRNWKAREHIRRKVKQRVLAGERCGICGKPIDLSLPQTWTDPKDGKVKRAHAYKSHLLNGHGKTTKRKRGLRKGAYADSTNAATVKRMIPYK